MVMIGKGTRITGSARHELGGELGEKYAADAGLRELAEQSGRSCGFMHQVPTEAGVGLRGRGGG